MHCAPWLRKFLIVLSLFSIPVTLQAQPEEPQAQPAEPATPAAEPATPAAEPATPAAEPATPAEQPTEAEPTPEEAAEAEHLAREQAERLTTLTNFLESIAAIRVDLHQLETERQNAETDEEKETIGEEIASRAERIEALENDFAVLASGIDRDAFFQKEQEEFDWKEQLEQVFSPLILDLREATARPREMEGLRSQLAAFDKRLPQIEEALAHLGELVTGAEVFDPNETFDPLEQAAGAAATDEEPSESLLEDGAVSQQLTSLTEFWQQQQDEFQSQRDAAQQRLEELEAEDVGFSESAGNLLRLFFKKRGTNLVLALLAFAAIFVALRALHRAIHRYLPVNRESSHARQLIFRVADVAYYLFTVIVASGAVLVVLYLSADWILLTLAVLVLVGLVWAARNAIPTFLEQGKLLLNVGAVREGERLTYNGIPWKVEVLSFFTDLTNPSLRGGTIRLPIQDLIGLRSRPVVDDEPWFPSEIGHWVVLEDGTYGEIVEQTPDVVIVSTARGSDRSYPPVDFIAQHPKNLSSSFFSVNHVVGLDYRYRDIVNTEVAAKLKATLEEGFKKMFYGEHLVTVIVEFKAMSASSLDLITIAKFKGPAASEYTEIGWKLQQLALDCCNENGWDIPFPQITVHRAEG